MEGHSLPPLPCAAVDGISQPAHRTDASHWQYGPFGGLSFDAAQFFRRFHAQRPRSPRWPFPALFVARVASAIKGKSAAFFSSAAEDSCSGSMQCAARP